MKIRDSLFLSIALAVASAAVRADEPLQEVIVTATLRDTSAVDLPESVTVLGPQQLQAAGVQHLEDVLGLIPNLSWAGGSSRPRFFQLRGIGEVEQYQGAPNPSVGFLIDDIDFSGVGMPATLFDTQQVEVLRGPQGTVYGANALAGLISVRTQDPTPGFSVHGEATVGDYQTRAGGLELGDSNADGTAGWRVAAQQYRSNGYRYDAYLQRDDTNGYDEGTLRAKLFWQFTPQLRADLALMDVDLNNGYDAWSADNSFTTQSNQPGRDAQHSTGASLRLSWHDDRFGELRSISSAAHSAIVYSFDSDWGNDPYWAACCDYSPYDYFEQDRRTRSTVAEDLRLIGDADHLLFDRARWLLGVYALRLTESDDLLDTWDDASYGAGSNLLHSDYSATNFAGYGSLDVALGTSSTLSLGLRAERRDAHYQDSADDLAFPDEGDTMLGGNLSWSLRTSAQQNLYVTLARGYKGGGFNIGSSIEPSQRRFAPEYLWSLESGVKRETQDKSIQWQADVFYMRRQNMQVYTSQQLEADNPSTFVFFTQNAAHGDNYGMESQAQWQIDSAWQLSGSAALLHTRYLGYDQLALGLSSDSGAPALDGRAQSYAPEYQLSAALSYTHPSGVFARLDGWATDGFYFAAGHDQVAQAYQLFNFRIGYQHAAWQSSIWIRNVLDRRYAVQGFYFGLVPPDFPTQRFIQNGDPRTIGLSIRYELRQSEQ